MLTLVKAFIRLVVHRVSLDKGWLTKYGSQRRFSKRSFEMKILTKSRPAKWFLSGGAVAVFMMVCVHEWGTFGLNAQAQSTGSKDNSAVVRTLPDFADLVDQVGPSVVNIRTLERAQKQTLAGGDQEEEMQELFRRFFGIPIPNMPSNPGVPGVPKVPKPKQAPRSEEEQPKGVGSGFILSTDGYIMTNAHVVDESVKVIVTLPDKREFKAKIVGVDRRTDVAVVKIDATNLPAVKIGDISKLRVGEWVMAIGSPFGLDNSVTAGIVSAKQRDTGEFLPFIQTDVAINPGNSGGPLINMRGEVVGINSQIYSRSGGYMGISFSIPIDEAIRVSDQLRASGRVQRGRLGVQIDQVSKDVADNLGLGKTQGALVRGIEANSPAEKAGVEAGDIITRFDGKSIEKFSDLPRIVGNTKPGTNSVMTVFRRGSNKELSVVVGEFEKEVVAENKDESSDKPGKVASYPSLGLTLTELTDSQRKELKLKGGVRIETASDSAAMAGLREGDVIIALANVEITNLNSFDTVASRLDKSKPVSLLIRRGAWAQYTLIRPINK
jgi:serine protease Do